MVYKIQGPRRILGLMFLLWVVLSGAGLTTAQEDPANTASSWNEQSRFTVLVMGLDRRPGEAKTLSARTDAIMLVSIDPQAGRIGLLHIPRDLYLAPVNSEELMRVNTLVLMGETREEGSGPQFAVDTMQYNLGMYIDRYVIFEFDAFIQVIDAIGGIEITTTYPIYDQSYPSMTYTIDPYYLPAGTHSFDGEEALKYARTRHGDNDFVRGIRQMQVVQAVHEKLTEGDTLVALLPELPTLLDALRDNVYTNLALEEMVQLARVGVTIPGDNIVTGGITDEDILLYSTSGGTNIYIPDRTKLAELLAEVFGEGYNL